MNEQKNRLLNYLANKELSLGCVISVNEIPDTGSGIFFSHTIMGKDIIKDDTIAIHEYGGDVFGIEKTIGHPVMIGDVLEKIKNNPKIDRYKVETQSLMTVRSWRPCGFTKSLNEIFDAELERHTSNKSDDHVFFKNKNIQALWEFLWENFKDKLK